MSMHKPRFWGHYAAKYFWVYIMLIIPTPYSEQNISGKYEML